MKINVIEIIDKNAYLIKLGQLSNSVDYYINRKKINNELIRHDITISKSDILEYIPKSSQLIGYHKGENFMSVEEYKSKPKSYDEHTSEEGVLRAIANRKELEGFEPKYKEPDFEKIEIEVYGNIQETGSKYINCMLTSCFSNEAILYSLDVNKVTIDEYNKLRDEYSSHAKFEDLDRSYIRYAKINNNFAFSDYYPFSELSKLKAYTSLEEAKKEELEIRNIVRTVALKKIFPKNMDDNKKLIIISQLRAIKKAKSKSTMDEMINILISDLQEYKQHITINNI